MIFYQIADIFFVVFHAVIILFNVLGWIFKKTRKYNLALLILTGLSWGVLGIWYGFGYCPVTDWHWDVLRKLGSEPEFNSYIQYLVKRLTGIIVSSKTADLWTGLGFALSLILSLLLNIRDYLKKPRLRKM